MLCVSARHSTRLASEYDIFSALLLLDCMVCAPVPHQPCVPLWLLLHLYTNRRFA